MPSYGFFPAQGTDYTRGDEPRIASALNRLGKALRIHLIGISGYRSPAHSVAVGGFADDPHTRGQASDTPGVESVPESTLRRFGLTRPFSGAAEADHIQLLRGGTTTARPRGRRGGPADWLTQAGWPRNMVPIMVAIGGAESGWRVGAVSPPNTNGTVDYGWLQINSVHGYDPRKLTTDPVYNARAGLEIFKRQGLGAWSTYNSGAYRQFMGRTPSVNFGRVRPGGDPSSGGPDSIDTLFADYLQEDSGGTAGTSQNQNVLFGLPGGSLLGGGLGALNPLNLFKDTKNAINDAADFLKWIAWIFHPRNLLRVVEFSVGMSLIVTGIITAIQVHKGDETSVGRAARTAVEVSPPGRALRLKRAASVGRRTARTAARTEEVAATRARAHSKERAKQRGKRTERDMMRKYGDVPF